MNVYEHETMQEGRSHVQFTFQDLSRDPQLKVTRTREGRPLATLGSVVMVTMTPQFRHVLVVGRVAQQKTLTQSNAMKQDMPSSVGDLALSPEWSNSKTRALPTQLRQDDELQH